MTNPTPGDPAGATAPDESSQGGASEQLLDAGSTGTDEGPAGLPASMVGQDKDGDPVGPPPAARAGTDPLDTGPASEADPLSPSDTSAPQQSSAGRSESG